MPPSTISTGEKAIARKAITMMMGLSSKPAPTPKRAIKRPVPNS